MGILTHDHCCGCRCETPAQCFPGLASIVRSTPDVAEMVRELVRIATGLLDLSRIATRIIATHSQGGAETAEVLDIISNRWEQALKDAKI